jgi:ADP-heptose:LPS heptosyltransferase
MVKLRDLLRRKPPRPVRRILFIELSEMGSTVLADPALRKARDRTGADIYFAIFAKNAGSLAITGTIAPAHVFKVRTNSLWALAVDTLAFLIWTRRQGIDTVIDLELFSRFSGLLTGLSGAERRIGFYRFHSEGLYRGDMLTHRVVHNSRIHVAKNFIALVNALLSETPTVPYSKTIIPDEEVALPVRRAGAAARERMTAQIAALVPHRDLSRLRIVLINPNSSEMLQQRRWMPERYIELVRRILAAHDDVLVLITGAAGERDQAEHMAAQCANDRCVAFAGHTKLTELPALYELASLIVSNDSGPAHFAAASALPTIVLFGPETPTHYGPLGKPIVLYAGLACSPCVSVYNSRKSACTDNVCMQAITVEQVFAAVESVLKTRVREPA